MVEEEAAVIIISVAEEEAECLCCRICSKICCRRWINIIIYRYHLGHHG